MQKYNCRREVPEKYKWDLSDFFKNDKEFDSSYKKCEKLIEELGKYKGCTKDSKKVFEFLEKEFDTIALWEDLYVYSYLINDQELGVSKSVERKGRAEQLCSLLDINTSFFAPELLKLSTEEYSSLFDDGLLGKYKDCLDRIYRDKDHYLSENEEMIVSELCSSMDHYSDMSSNLINSEHDYGKVTLDDGSKVVIATNNYRKLMKNDNQALRKKIYMMFNKKLEQYSASSALYLNSYVAMNNSIAKIRKYKDSWDAKLFDLNMSDKVFKTLLKSVEDNVDSMHKYYALKKKALGLDELHIYDLPLQMSKSKKEYSIEEAQEIVKEALAPLGNDYLKKLNKVFDNHYIDYCQYKGKCSGGYSFSTLNHDSRILLSFNDDLESVSTIIHEAGHNVHHQFCNENNILPYRDFSSIVSEVASLTNECLLSEYISKNAKTKEEKLAGLENIIDVIVSNLFGAVREGKLEQDMYKLVKKGGTLTNEYLNKITKASLKKYYGKEVKSNKYIKNSWITRSHYYMHFYLYSYAICVSVASYVASSIVNGDKEMLDKYIEFLKCGSDKWPSEVFEVLGIDLEDENVYLKAISYFDSLINRYNDILDGKE